MWSPKTFEGPKPCLPPRTRSHDPLTFFFFVGTEHSRLKGLTVGKALGCPSGKGRWKKDEGGYFEG
jgi:hypothetical protein